MNFLLSFIIFCPMVGALCILLFARGDVEIASQNSRKAALWTSLVTFVLSLMLLVEFDKTTAAFQFVEHVQWVEGYNIAYHLGIDGISLFFILLTTFLMPICIKNK